MDIQAAKKRCEAAAGNTGCFPAPWRADETTIFARDGAIIMCCIETNEIAEFVAHAVSDLPAALEAMEEAQGKLKALRKWGKIFAGDNEEFDAILPLY